MFSQLSGFYFEVEAIGVLLHVQDLFMTEFPTYNNTPVPTASRVQFEQVIPRDLKPLCGM